MVHRPRAMRTGSAQRAVWLLTGQERPVSIWSVSYCVGADGLTEVQTSTETCLVVFYLQHLCSLWRATPVFALASSASDVDSIWGHLVVSCPLRSTLRELVAHLST